MKRFDMFRWGAFVDFHRYNVENLWTNASRDARLMFWLLIGINDLFYYPLVLISFIIGLFLKNEIEITKVVTENRQTTVNS